MTQIDSENRLGPDGPVMCRSCRAPVSWNPDIAALDCEYCGDTTAVSAPPLPPARPLATADAPTNEAAAAHLGQVRCGRCGARALLEPPVVAGPCTFCGAPTAVESEADCTLSPDGIAPFTVPRAQVEIALRRWLGASFFAPNDVASLARVEALTPVYMPCWSFDEVRVKGSWRAEKFRPLQEDNGEVVTGKIDTTYRDFYPVYAGTGLPPDDWRLVLSGDDEAVSGYHPGFLKGQAAEAASRSAAECVDDLPPIIEGRIEPDYKPERSYSFKVMGLEVEAVSCRQVLLPLWIAVFHYRGKLYRCLVGGHSGLVHGEAPTSGFKVTLAVVGFTILSVLLILVLAVNCPSA